MWKRQEKIRSATIPRVTSSTYFQVNDNYYPGRTRAAVCWPQFPQIIALFIWQWVDPVSFSFWKTPELFRRFRGRSTHANAAPPSFETRTTEREEMTEQLYGRMNWTFHARLRVGRNVECGFRIYYSFSVNRGSK